MIGGRRALCLIPARGGSKGLPGKNLLELGGMPLVAWPISAALESTHVDRVVCSTDDPEIAEAARAAGAEVPFVRPAALASDHAATVDVISHTIDFLADNGDQFDYVSVLEPTSPLTEGSDLDSALELLDMSAAFADAVVGVGSCGAVHPDFCVSLGAGGAIRLLYGQESLMTNRRQQLRPMFFLDGSLYVSRVDTLLTVRSFVHERTLAMGLPRWKNLEIDDLLDFTLIEAVLSRRGELRDRYRREPSAGRLD